MPSDDFLHADSAAQFVLGKTSLRPKVGLVLGSGLGSFAEGLSGAVRIPYAQIPRFPCSTAIGHAGQLVMGRAADVPVAVMKGRVHLYEGYSAREVAFPIRVLGRMGIQALVITNATGGINFDYKPGDLVLITDHINLQNQNPLIGQNDDRFGPRFPDMTRAYWKPYQQIAREEARRLGIPLQEGVYAGWLGPNFETPAEIRYLRTIGADLVGWSTVSEVIVARHMGIKVLAISCVTNLAAGMLDQPLSHEEVIETGARVSASLESLLNATIPRLRES
jgi:purine-nucleoside phosphorylase